MNIKLKNELEDFCSKNNLSEKKLKELKELNSYYESISVNEIEKKKSYINKLKRISLYIDTPLDFYMYTIHKGKEKSLINDKLETDYYRDVIKNEEIHSFQDTLMDFQNRTKKLNNEMFKGYEASMLGGKLKHFLTNFKENNPEYLNLEEILLMESIYTEIKNLKEPKEIFDLNLIILGIYLEITDKLELILDSSQYINSK